MKIHGQVCYIYIYIYIYILNCYTAGIQFTRLPQCQRPVKIFSCLYFAQGILKADQGKDLTSLILSCHDSCYWGGVPTEIAMQ